MKVLSRIMMGAAGLLFVTMSCSNGSGDAGFDGFKHENWKIDSVLDASNVNIQPQMKEAEVYVLNFRKDSVLNSFVIEGGSSEILPIGTWKYTADNVTISSEQEKLTLKCSYDEKISSLILDGNFNVRSRDKKLRYYLSKYLKPL